MRVLSVFLVLCLAPCAAAYDVFEDFEDGVADGFTVIEGSWTVENGTYNSHAAGLETFSYTRYGEDTWTDYVVSASVKVSGSINHVIHVRGDGLHNTYSINLRSEPYNDLIIAKRVNDDLQILSQISYANTAGEWHDLKITVLGPMIEFVVDQTVAGYAIDTFEPFLTGPPYLVAYSGGIDQVVSFDDFIVAFLPVTAEESSWGQVKTMFR